MKGQNFMETSQLEKMIYQYEHDFFSCAFCTNIKDLESRIADGFIECGVSGIHTRQDVINSLSQITLNREISLNNFHFEKLSDTVVLVRYEAFMKDINRLSFHSSIWVQVNDDWKIFYHQATRRFYLAGRVFA